MLIDFSIKNYRSFKDEQTFSMIAAETGEKIPDHPENQFNAGQFNLLKSAAIYGPNAAGKSNLLLAMKAFAKFIATSAESERVGQKIVECLPFLFKQGNPQLPTKMECRILINGEIYRYGFEASMENIHSEWLYRTKKREVPLFLREEQKLDLRSGFKEGQGLESKVRENALFLTVSAQFNGKIATELLEKLNGNWFFNLSQQDMSIFHMATEAVLKESPKALTQVLELLRAADTQVQDITLNETDEKVLSSIAKEFSNNPDKQKEIIDNYKQTTPFQFHHKFFNDEDQSTILVPLSLSMESKGTQKLFHMASSIFMALGVGGLLIVDELEDSLHPLIMEQVIQLFHDPEKNPKNAQLIFTTHATEVLARKLFRRDQIWFAEKNKYGATELFSLLDINGVRKDMAYGKNYLLGRFGAVPNIKPFSV